MARFYATTNPDVSERERQNENRSRRIAAEGMVLLENNGILPMALKGRKIALFGNGARHTVQGGTGSGEVNTRTIRTVEQGLEHAGAEVTTKAWLDRYDALCGNGQEAYLKMLQEKYPGAPEMVFWSMFSYRTPLTIPTMEGDFASSDTGTALYILARNSGEGSDRRNVPGDYQLHQEEKDFLDTLCRHYRHVVVVLNVGGVIDTAFLRSHPGIDAVLLMGQAGNSGGDALADVLSGKVSPCGHLATTWAARYEDYPNADSFGYVNGNLDDEYYTEGIYVGYRWFDSFGKTPAYPFGYGRSYTSFSVETTKIDVKDSTVTVFVQVQNTGKRYAGREVVQVYASAPEGNLDKPYQELVGYRKTGTLQPGYRETLEISFPLSAMASYSESHAAWILEKGDYLIRVGVHSRDTKVACILRLERDCICEKLRNVFPLDCEMRCLKPDRKEFYHYEAEDSEKSTAKVITLEDVRIAKDEAGKHPAKPRPVLKKMLTMKDVLSGRATVEDLAAQLTAEELVSLCVGTARGGAEESSAIGAASISCPGAAGETTSELLASRDIRKIVLADGPAGLRLAPSFMVDSSQKVIWQAPALGSSFMGLMTGGKEAPALENAVTYYQYCTAIPTATLLAQTWDLDAIRETGDIIGSEMEEFGITLWLAPGMNIHRNPLCGRNFEYFSEDPLVSGLCAAYSTLGVQSHPGVGTTIKHFACNNQEDNRAYTIAHVTERTLREIYLKGFEIAIKLAQPMSVMSSYNMINGVHAANSADLLTKVAREEWGFSGLVMTDWGTTAEAKPDLEGKLPLYGCSSAAACIKAGNDLLMPGSQEDVNEIIASLGAAEGQVTCPITLEELRTCAARILQIIARSNAYEGCVPYKVAIRQ